MMGYFQKAFNDTLFIRITFFIWSIPFFILAVWMILDFSRLVADPKQFVGVLLLTALGGVCIYLALYGENSSILKRKRGMMYSDIFFFVFALISLIPTLAIWEIVRRNKRI